jgi:hypothetical protein
VTQWASFLGGFPLGSEGTSTTEISIDWPTRVIYVPLVALTPIGGGIYVLDLETFRFALRYLEGTDDGMFFPATHDHNPPVDIGGTTLAQVVLLINGYTVTFEDGEYAVSIVGGNSNVGQNVNVNRVSVRSSNSAGLVDAGAGIANAVLTDPRTLTVGKYLGLK